ncbi:hypothetical protein GCM10027261_14400 [Geodermatophilus arenarius]
MTGARYPGAGYLGGRLYGGQVTGSQVPGSGVPALAATGGPGTPERGTNTRARQQTGRASVPYGTAPGRRTGAPSGPVLSFAAVTPTGGTYGTGPRRDGWAAGHVLRLTAGRRRHEPPSAMKNNNNHSRHHGGTGGRLPGSTALRGRPTDARLVSRGAEREATCGPQDRVRAHVPRTTLWPSRRTR